jgi:LysR family transcriptional regulator, low CO2-responsive transcriptional regulator
MARTLPVGTLVKYTTLRQLQVFEAVARLSSFTRAADELYLAQPTVSMQIKKLADSIGHPLFEQSGGRIQMTEMGKEVYTTCHDVFGALENLEMKIAAVEGMKRGRLKIAVLTSAKYLGPHVIGGFHRVYPEIDIELKVTNRENLLKRVHRHDDDLYILGKPPEGLDAEAFPLLPNPLVVMARYDHPLAREKHIPLKRLIQEPLIMREQGSGTRAAFEQLVASKGMTLPAAKMEFASNEAIKQAIVADLGVSVMSRQSLVLEGENGPISILDVQGFPIERDWYVLHPKGRKLSIVAEAFIDFVRNEGRTSIENFEASMKDLRFRLGPEENLPTG